MKKFTLLVLMLCITAYTWSQTFYEDGLKYKVVDIAGAPENSVEVFGYENNAEGDVVIPQEVTYSGTTYTVASVGYKAFYNYTENTSITLPSTIVKIKSYAFYNNTKLATINLSDCVVETIDAFAFYNCDSLATVTTPSSLKSLGRDVFTSNYKLKNVVFNSDVKFDGIACFSGCTQLNNLVLPNIDSLPAKTFYSCSGLKNITIPSSLKYIGEMAFYNSGLTSIDLPNVDYIETEAFKNCTTLDTITAPKVTFLVEESFYNSGSRVANFPLVEWVGIAALSKARFSSIELPSVDSIAEQAFEDAVYLKTVDIPKATYIGELAFSGTEIVTLNAPLVERIETKAFSDFSGTTLELPSVKYIGTGAFNPAYSLVTIDLPVVDTIMEDCFLNSRKLTDIVFPATLKATGSNIIWPSNYVKSITCLAPTPPEMLDIGYYVCGAFQFSSYLDTIYVPYGCAAAYENDECWSQYIIQELKFDVTPDSLVFSSQGGSQTIQIRPNGKSWAMATNISDLISFTRPSGTGDYDVEITAGANTSGQLVRGIILLSDEDGQKDTVKITIKSKAVAAWASPSDISYGTALSNTQLNATANFNGTFTYSPVLGSILEPGTHELSAIFTPDEYGIENDTAKVSITVKKASLSLSGIAVDNKTYDGTTTATYTGGTLSGLVEGDDVSFTITSLVFNDKLVAVDKPVTATVTLSGGDKAYYEFTQPTGLTATISAKELSYESITANDKEYDGTTTVTFTTGSLQGLVSGDVVNVLLEGSFNDQSIGSDKPVTVTVNLQGDDKSNYSFKEYADLTAAITKKTLTLSNAVAQNKVYDGDNSAEITFDGINGVVAGETVNVEGYGTFNNSSVGEDIPVTALLNITGADWDNYQLEQPNGLTANITPKELTVVGAMAEDKIYDGNTEATITGASLTGVALSDADYVDLNLVSANFADKNVGTSKDISVVYQLNGTLSSNYTLVQPIGLTAAITPATLILTNFTAADKVYDATSTVSGTGFDDNRISGDDLTLTYAAAFDTKNAGSNKTVYFSDITVTGGADKDNYVLDATTGTATATISGAALTVTANDISKKQGETYGFTGSEFVAEGIYSGDVVSSVTLSSEGGLSTASIGTYVINISNATGTGVENYDITYIAGEMTVTDKIIPEITWSNPFDITYGIALSATQLNATALYNGEAVNGNYTYSKNSGDILEAGSGQVLTVVFTPEDNNSYQTVSKAVNINVLKAMLTVTAQDYSRLFGVENPEFTYTYSGFVNSEDESVLDEAPTATCEATTESAVGTYDIEISGGSDNNYEFSYTNGTLTISATSDLNETNKELAFTLFPNPVRNSFCIAGFAGEATVTIYNVQGRLMQRKQVSANKSIDVGSLKSGMYVVRIQSTSGVAVKTISKE